MIGDKESRSKRDSGDGFEAYRRYARPRLSELLHGVGLDVSYVAAEGDYLYRESSEGERLRVLDLLGGYGAALFGHNHPTLVEEAAAVLREKRPFLAQASIREPAGLLARRLSELVGLATGWAYLVTIQNSGAGAVEAAIKHAEMEMSQRIAERMAALRQTFRNILVAIRDGSVRRHAGFLDEAARRLDVGQLCDLDDLFLHLFRLNLDVFRKEPVFLSFRGAFHGKTTGALKLTANPGYRDPWSRIGIRVRFLPVGDRQALKEAIVSERVAFFDLEPDRDGWLRLVERSYANIAACFIEPVQGEGGIRPVPVRFLAELREEADREGFPLVMDEIQSGMGRTGTFLASEKSGVEADYYLLSKSLGGGLAKISALLVSEDHYLPDFGYLHTSTFAEDDFSCRVALAALDLLERDRIPARAAKLGKILKRGLEALRSRFPKEIREVRGEGLLLGVELEPQPNSPSPLIRVLSDQELLGFVVCGSLLHEGGFRTAPALSDRTTIRIEPSAYLPPEEFKRFLDALAAILRAIHEGDAGRLVRYLAGRAGDDGVCSHSRCSGLPPGVNEEAVPGRSRSVAFLAHFLDAGQVAAWDPSLAGFTEEDCRALLDRMRGLLAPFPVTQCDVRSLRSERVRLHVIGIPFTAQQVMRSRRYGEDGWATRLVMKGVALAKEKGCTLAGFGGYTSILTDNCRDVIDDALSVTSGNSLTVAAALLALERVARDKGIESARVGILGATGNIGLVLAQVIADRVGDIVLVGRKGAKRRLAKVAAEVYFGAWKRLLRTGTKEGLAGAIGLTEAIRGLRCQGAAGIEQPGEWIRLAIDRDLGAWAPVRIATDLNALQGCNIILTASNAPSPVLLPDHVAEGPVVICDVATPRDVAPSLHRQRPDATVIRGGLLRLPLGQTIEIPGMPDHGGAVFGCLAETLVLGLAGVAEDFSRGRLTPGLVRRIGELAHLHGFEVEALLDPPDKQ